MPEKSDISGKEFLRRVAAGLVVLFVISIIYTILFIPLAKGLFDTILLSAGVFVYIAGVSAVIPIIIFFGSLIFGDKVGYSFVCNLFFIICVIALIMSLIGVVYR